MGGAHKPSWDWGAMALMEIRLFLFGVAFGLLGVGVLCHFYSSLLPGRFTSFVLGGPDAAGSDGGLVDLRELLVPAVQGGAKVHQVCKGNRLHVQANGKICEGAKEMTSSNLLSNHKQKQMEQMLSLLLWPLAVYHNLSQHLYIKLQPALQRLDFSVRGYMMSKHKERQSRHHIWREHPAGADESDSEEELAAFCPKLDDAVVAKELTFSDSEHSDAEVSYTENGTFNLSRGQTPLTEGSEDFDGHSDPEESFARDLPDFPSINPEMTGIDDEDDTSIGIPSLAPHHRAQEENQQSHKQEAVTSEFLLSELPLMHNLTDDLASFVTRGMIQLALSGTSQSVAMHNNRQQQNAKAFLRTSSSELDTDAEGDDFELLDQSELNQMDPSNSRGQ